MPLEQVPCEEGRQLPAQNSGQGHGQSGQSHPLVDPYQAVTQGRPEDGDLSIRDLNVARPEEIRDTAALGKVDLYLVMAMWLPHEPWVLAASSQSDHRDLLFGYSPFLCPIDSTHIRGGNRSIVRLTQFRIQEQFKLERPAIG